jgi:hypothetical protein
MRVLPCLHAAALAVAASLLLQVCKRRASWASGFRHAGSPCQQQAVPGLLETSPGVRSCMIEYDQRVLPLARLLALLEQVEAELPSVRIESKSQPQEIHTLPLHSVMAGPLCMLLYLGKLAACVGPPGSPGSARPAGRLTLLWTDAAKQLILAGRGWRASKRAGTALCPCWCGQ